MATHSSFSFGSILILCLIFVSLITPSTSNYLSDLCIKCKSPRFCLQVFGLNPHRRPYALTLEAINLTFTNATKTTKKIHTFLDQTNDENLKEIYDYCLDYYESSIELLRGVEEYLLKNGKYDTLSHIGNFVKEVGLYCENKFRQIPNHVYVSTLTNDNKNLWIFGSIIMSAADILTNSTS
ncbi:hypothetical protein EJD97_004411 [Solanum chilense]|uniref:Pectinesterase inhibitor domain-containing protein n=1 Tax=Solanum chilense TaxID=4083 RepID=A0A6N2AK17_SOLCI|nr:hypothetical protein EJD97_004411 [Solanum chilense]